MKHKFVNIFFSPFPAIPHFKAVVIMATTCDGCGHRTSEVKSGAGVEPRGTRITLRVTSPADMSRDVLKARTYKFLVGIARRYLFFFFWMRSTSFVPHTCK